MKPKITFVHKFLSRLEKVDRDSVAHYVLGLAGSNAAYEEILDNLEEGVLITDAHGFCKFANARVSEWLDIPRKGYENRKLSDLISDPGLMRFIGDDLSSIREKKIGYLDLISPREMNLCVIMTPLDHSPSKDILILLSDSERENSRSLSIEKMARIESLMKLTSGIAHEIGNPLNSIGIHLQLLGKQIADLPSSKREGFEKGLRIIAAETERLNHIIRNFLQAARRPPLRFQLENLNAVLEDAISFLGEEMKKNGVLCRFRADETLPAFLLDRERLYQAFINLLLNAMEAMPKGGTLKIAIRHREKLVTVEFRDSGSGIAPEDLPHIFEPYYTTKPEGSGLGLMTVYNVVTEHGGQVEVSSKPGKGSLFTLRLPLRQPKLQLPQYKNK